MPSTCTSSSMFVTPWCMGSLLIAMNGCLCSIDDAGSVSGVLRDPRDASYSVLFPSRGVGSRPLPQFCVMVVSRGSGRCCALPWRETNGLVPREITFRSFPRPDLGLFVLWIQVAIPSFYRIIDLTATRHGA